MHKLFKRNTTARKNRFARVLKGYNKRYGHPTGRSSTGVMMSPISRL